MTDNMEFEAAVRALFGARFVAGEDAAPYLTDWWGKFRGRARGVAFPVDTPEVAAIVRLCSRHGVPIVPQGGNTGLCGAATADDTGRALVVCLGRMNRIRQVDPLNNALAVDAGCVLADIQRVADAQERFFPMQLGSEGSCQIGGNLATNSGGMTVLRYGTMRDLVLGIEVVLPDGRIWNGMRSLRKNNAGYELKNLFIGSEGTLGIITGAVLKLFPKPRKSLVAMASLPDLASAVRLLACVRGIVADQLNTFEVMCDRQMALLVKHIPGLRNPLGVEGRCYAFMEITHMKPDEDLAETMQHALAMAMEQGLVLDATIPASVAQEQAIWRLRHSVSEANKDEGVNISHDTSVPVSLAPQFIADCTAVLERTFPEATVLYVGHVGDGNLHLVAIFPRDPALDAAALEHRRERVNGIVFDAVRALDGSLTAEHGIGQLHVERLQVDIDPTEYDLMCMVTRALAPAGLMNPGKVLAPARLAPR
jgi:FAD/FMN-containing dehydrogenase